MKPVVHDDPCAFLWIQTEVAWILRTPFAVAYGIHHEDCAPYGQKISDLECCSDVLEQLTPNKRQAKSRILREDDCEALIRRSRWPKEDQKYKIAKRRWTKTLADIRTAFNRPEDVEAVGDDETALGDAFDASLFDEENTVKDRFSCLPAGGVELYQSPSMLALVRGTGAGLPPIVVESVDATRMDYQTRTIVLAKLHACWTRERHFQLEKDTQEVEQARK